MASDQSHPQGSGDAEHVSEEAGFYFILVGKGGGGKSATGNTILGEEKFESKASLQPVTQDFCGQRRAKEWKGMRVVVVDSPAVFDAKDWRNVDKIRKSLSEVSPGLHALVFVTQVGNFTQGDKVAMQSVEKIFGLEARRHMVLLFTRKEDLGGESLEGYIKGSGNTALQELVKKCEDRCCAFNNKAVREERDAQVEDLLCQMEKVMWREWGSLHEEPSRQPQGSAAAGETDNNAMDVDERARPVITYDGQVKAPGAKGFPFKCLKVFKSKKGTSQGEGKSQEKSLQTGGKFFSGSGLGRLGRAAGGAPGKKSPNAAANPPPNRPAVSSHPGRSPHKDEGLLLQSPGQPDREGDFISSLRESDLRILLVGKAGGGKSASGNTILGEEKFESKLRLKLETQTLRAEFWAKEWKGRRVVVIDTPAVFDAKVKDRQNADKIRKSLSQASQGPHVLVFVTQVGRFTQEDKVALQWVEEIFGPRATRHMVLLFTRKEDLEGDSLKNYIKDSGNTALQELVKKCEDRCCAFNNKEAREERHVQVEELLLQVEKVMQKQRSKEAAEEQAEEADEDFVILPDSGDQAASP